MNPLPKEPRARCSPRRGMQHEQRPLELFSAEPVQPEVLGGKPTSSSLGPEVPSTSHYPKLQPALKVSHKPGVACHKGGKRRLGELRDPHLVPEVL